MSDLIERRAAIDSIRECVEAAHSNHEWDMEQGYLNAIECIEEEPSAEPRWIPVTERSPEEDCETGKGVQYSDFVLMSVEHKEDEETMVDYGHTVDGKCLLGQHLIYIQIFYMRMFGYSIV